MKISSRHPKIKCENREINRKKMAQARRLCHRPYLLMTKFFCWPLPLTTNKRDGSGIKAKQKRDGSGTQAKRQHDKIATDVKRNRDRSGTEAGQMAAHTLLMKLYQHVKDVKGACAKQLGRPLPTAY
jgi:hypothetical protein